VIRSRGIMIEIKEKKIKNISIRRDVIPQGKKAYRHRDNRSFLLPKLRHTRIDNTFGRTAPHG